MFPLLIGASMAAPAAVGLYSMFQSGGLRNACQGMLGTPERGALTGAVTGGLTSFLMTGNPMAALFGAGVGAGVGALIGRHNERRCQPQGCHNFPPPYGQGYGGPQCGGYFPGAYQQGWQQGYQQGFQQGQWQQGYQQGWQQGWNQGQHHYGGHPGCFPPGGHWNNGCPPQNHCRPPHGTGNPGGQLCQKGEGKPIEYTTSGGWKVRIDKDKTIITDPTGKNKIEHSGDPHEYVNGKHIKDWEGKQRTLALPDGTKITLTATGPHGLTTNTSIYDGDQNIQINNEKNEITHRSFDPYDTQMRERWQYDGETSAITYNNRGGINYTNYYTQDENFGVKSNYKDLATTQNERWWEAPFRPFWERGKLTVKDHYDDPRLLTT